MESTSIPQIPPPKKTRTCASMNGCSETVKFTQLIVTTNQETTGWSHPTPAILGMGPPSRKNTHHQQSKCSKCWLDTDFFHGETTTLSAQVHGAHHWRFFCSTTPISGAPSYTGSQNSSCSGPSVLPKVAVPKDGPNDPK